MNARLRRLKRVEEVEDYGMPDGEWMAHLAPGWAIEDAAARPEDDPDGANALHGKGGAVAYVVERVRDAEPCRCGRCVRLIAERDASKLTAAERAWIKAHPEVAA